jgi:hypothetical protein
MEWIPVVFITFKVLVLGIGMFLSIKWHYDKDRTKKAEARRAQDPAEHIEFASPSPHLAESPSASTTYKHNASKYEE